MNLLSWMIYLGDIAQGLEGFFIFMLIVCVLATFALGMAGGGCSSDSDKRMQELGAKFFWWLRVTIPMLFLSGLMIALIPSKTTFYLVAASEITDRAVLQDPDIQEILSLAKKRVMDYLKEENNESEGSTTEKHDN